MPSANAILFVDDDPLVLDSLHRSLCHCYSLTMACGPEQGLAAMREKGPFAVLVTDLRMPEMNGVAFLKAAKAIDPDIVPILLTGHADLENAMAAVNEGRVFRFLTKPCPIPTLTMALEAALEQYRLAASDKELVRVTLENARLTEDVERIMRHDLKSPLTTIIGLPQVLMMSENLDEEQREMLAIIEQAGYTMLAMVNLSAALFKMERGQYVLEPTAVDIVPVVRKIFTIHADTARSRNMALILLVDGESAAPETSFLVWGEELLCYSMLANLIANAVEASPEDAPLVVALHRDAGMAILEIRNKGTVPESIRDRFFEKYVTSGKSRGTGLGTYSARLIARAHRGVITMRTDEAAGTAVTVALPAI